MGLFYKSRLLLGVLLLVLPLTLAAKRPPTLEPQVIVHNRVLAKVNGKLITVMDVTKKLDVVFYREFPQYRDSIPARFQFYQMHWKMVLQELVDGELILTNAKDMKVEVSDGDVRQEIEERLGPDVVSAIAHLHISYEEAFQLISREMIIQKMTQNMAYSPAIAKVRPMDVKAAYEQFAKENPIEEGWTYRVLSCKSRQKLQALAAIQAAFSKLERGKNIEEVAEELKAQAGVQVVLSEPYERTEKTLSKAHKEGIASLQEGQFSDPVEAQGGGSPESTFRIFYLLKHTSPGVIPFREVESKIRNQLVDKAIEEESLQYRQRLRQRLKIDENYFKEMVPQDFEPYELLLPS